MKRSTKPHILHLFGDVPGAGMSDATARIIEGLGPELRHSVVFASASKNKINRQITIDYPVDFPRIRGWPLPGRLNHIARAMSNYDLICTYGWPAMNAVMAHTVFKDAMSLPPLIHHESEAEQPSAVRNIYRRFALGKSAGVVVSSERMEEMALVQWQQPIGRVKHIPSGIEVRKYAKRPAHDVLPGLIKRTGEKWVGTVANLAMTDELSRLIKICATLPENWHLVILGEGTERQAILDEADRLEVNHRVHMPGQIDDLSQVLGLFDIFASVSDASRSSRTLIEAMAAGLPIIAADDGDAENFVAQENRAFVASPHAIEQDLTRNITKLAADKGLRAKLGDANRRKALSDYDEQKSIATYRRLYASAMQRDDW